MKAITLFILSLFLFVACQEKEEYQVTQLSPDQREKLEFLLEEYAKARMYHKSIHESEAPSNLDYQEGKERTPEEKRYLSAFRSRSYHLRETYGPLIWDVYQEKYSEIEQNRSSDVETFKGEVSKRLATIIEDIDNGHNMDPIEYMRTVEKEEPVDH